MARVKSPAAKNHRKIIAKAKGFKQSRRKRIHVAMEAVMHAGAYAYHGRKRRKRDMRALWITRLSAASKIVGTSYSKLISGLKKEKIEIDRKILSDIAATDFETFKVVAKEAGFTPAPLKGAGQEFTSK
ncbi:MAG: 50S ribosomal protein L20 [Patescibacteria group bacterium]